MGGTVGVVVLLIGIGVSIAGVVVVVWRAVSRRRRGKNSSHSSRTVVQF